MTLPPDTHTLVSRKVLGSEREFGAARCFPELLLPPNIHRPPESYILNFGWNVVLSIR